MTEDRRINRAQWMLATLILTLALGRVAYGALLDHDLRQTAALFIGLPAFLAMVLVLTPKAKTVVGATVKGMTIAMLMSGIFLLEGFVCILMAAPLFYTVGILIALIVQLRRKKRDQRRTLGILMLPLMLMSLEGTSGALSFNRAETVTVREQVRAAPAQIEAALASEPEFELALPFYLRLGFPRPVYARGGGLDPGDTRTIGFAVGNQPPTELTLQVVESGPGFVRFRMVGDRTPVAEWLRMEQAVVEWHEIGSGQSVVSWTINYQRELDPAWYFGPMERYAVGLAAEYLIATVATP